MTSTSTQPATTSTVMNVADDPLCVNSNENVAVSLVTQPLLGDKNYLNWRKSMEMALDLAECFSGSNDFTIFSIEQEIAMLMHEDKSIAQYDNNLIQLWGDEDALTEEISCELGSRCKARR
ncbi:hypothetical protein QQ045_001519 [Rhodiola kirilowii]